MGIFSFTFSDISLLVYTNATNFCILILYPMTLLNTFVLIVWGCIFYIEYRISANSGSFNSPLSIWIPFLSHLIAVARTSNPTLNRNGESG